MLTTIETGLILRRNCHITTGGAVKQEPTLNIHEVAKIFGVDERTILRWLATGEEFIGAYKAGPGEKSPWRFPESVVDAQIRKRQSARILAVPKKKRRA